MRSLRRRVMRRLRWRALVPAAVAALVAGCGGEDADPVRTTPPAPSATPTPAPRTTTAPEAQPTATTGVPPAGAPATPEPAVTPPEPAATPPEDAEGGAGDEAARELGTLEVRAGAITPRRLVLPLRLGGRLRLRSVDGRTHAVRFEPPLEGIKTHRVGRREAVLVLSGPRAGRHTVRTDGGGRAEIVVE